MGLASASLSRCLCLCVRLTLFTSVCSVVSAFIARHCRIFDEDLLSDMGGTVPCQHIPGLGPYAECIVKDFRTDLSEVGPEVRSLCIYQHASVIPSNAFSHIPSLGFLRIYGREIERVQSGAFSGLPNLKKLWILFGDNDILCKNAVIEPHAFIGLGHLKELGLIQLSLVPVPNGTFDPLVMVRRLTLDKTCASDLSEILCRLPATMSCLELLSLKNSGISTIRAHSCVAKSAKLTGVQTLLLHGNPITIIQTNSMSMFQNLSTLSMEFHGEWLGSIWESGIEHLTKFTLTAEITRKPFVDFKYLCHLILHLHVEDLELEYIQMKRLSVKDLQNCGTSLRKLSIVFSRVEQLDPGFWMSMLGIETLRFVHMNLSEAPLCAAGNGTVWNITALNLMQNSLTSVHAGQFQCMPLLEELILSENQIKALERGAFRGLTRLRVLKLDHNQIAQLTYYDFEFLSALEVLLIDHNLISVIEWGTFRNQKELRELTVGKISSIPQLHLSMIFEGFPPKIENLSIAVLHETVLVIGNISAPNGTLTLTLQGETFDCNDCDNPVFKSVRELKVISDRFTCCGGFFGPYFSNLESFELTSNRGKEIEKQMGINTLIHLKRLKLINLKFSEVTDPSMTFWNLAELRILVLVDCDLKHLTNSMFQDLSSLRLLRLYSTSSLILLDGVFEVLPSLKAVVFDKVESQCDCKNVWLLEWAERTPLVCVMNLQKQICDWHNQKLNFLSTMELCQTDVHYLVYLSTAITIALFLSTAVGYHHARWPRLVLLCQLRGWVGKRLGRRCRRGKERQGVAVEEEEEVKFDAFVSFSTWDEAWVLGEMVPRLEVQGHPKLKLCLHHRDLEAGERIVNRIAESTYSSRHTVCVISRQYLRSDWCSLEMCVAAHHLLAKQKHQLTLIFLEHISPFELSAFLCLANRMQPHKRLDWPEREVERARFWDLLRGYIAERETEAPQP